MFSSNMSSIESHLCGICQEQYNDSNRAPRVVCSEIHNICTQCLEDLLKKSKKKFICPFDRSEEDKKPLSQYPVNRGLLQIAQDLVRASNRKICTSCSAEATRLCLNCNEVQCSECMLEYHEGHKHLKLVDVPKQFTEKKNKLSEVIQKLEASTSGKETVNKLAKVKEGELKEKADAIFEEYEKILEKKKEVAINEIQKLIAEKVSHFLAKQPQNKKGSDELSQWISETKRITQQTIDVNSALCELLRQEKAFEERGLSKLQVKEPKEDLLFNTFLNEISLECNELFLENFKRSNPLKFDHKTTPSFEETKSDHSSSSERTPVKFANLKLSDSSNQDSESETSGDDYQDQKTASTSHSRNQSQQQSSEWIVKGSTMEQSPVQEEIQQLRNAFEVAKVDVQVRFVKASNAIRLDSIYEKTKAASSGLKGDESVEEFFNTISQKELIPALKKVISLNLICIGLTRNGSVHLSKAIEKLSSLEVFRVEFFNSGNLKHEDLKPLMQVLGRSKTLNTLSLSCQKWRYLQNFNLPYTIGDLALISRLKNLTLNFSECHGLSTSGVAEAFHGFSSLVSLEELKLTLNGCSKIDDDQDCLRSIYQVYSKMNKLQRIEFDFLRCPEFTERGAKTLIGPSKVNAGLVVKVNRG